MNIYDKIQINTDGGSRGNPGPSAIGVYITHNNQEVFSFSKYLGLTTNNVAEYTAVIEALKYLVENEIKTGEINFVLDSELVVKQINGLYKIKQNHLAELFNQIKKLVSQLIKDNKVKLVSFNHVLREKNKEADGLVNLCLDSH